MTTIFIIVFFVGIVIYDAALVYKDKQTITACFRHWYNTLIIIPFAIGVIFLGHFLDLLQNDPPALMTIIGLSASGLIALIISIVMRKNNIKLRHRALCLIPIVIGYFVGDVCW